MCYNNLVTPNAGCYSHTFSMTLLKGVILNAVRLVSSAVGIGHRIDADRFKADQEGSV